MTTRQNTPVDHSISQPRHELLAVAEAVAREKGIERDEVLYAMEQAIQKAARAKYGFEKDVRAKVDPETGDVSIWKVLTVVEEVEDDELEISLTDAHEINSNSRRYYLQHLT